MNEQLELIVKNEKGELSLAAQVETILDVCEAELASATSQYNEIKQNIINAMLDNSLKTAKVGKYKLAIREPKDKWNFDRKKFIEEENEDIVIAFSSIKTQRIETFDIEKLKSEFPEVYAKCLNVEETEVLDVDENKLWKTLNNVWVKYATKEEPKPATITIKKEGE